MQKQKLYLIILITITLIKQTSNSSSNEKSIKICGNSPSYLLEYYSKNEIIKFDDFKVNRDHAHPIYEMVRILNDKNYDENNIKKDLLKYLKEYLKRLIPYITFMGLSIITLITFIIICFCWSKPHCCYKDNNNFLRSILFIICIVFLLGIFSCCISGFVFAERFTYYLNGGICSIERLFYNIDEGQLNLINPKWNGFEGIITKLNKLKNLELLFSDENPKKYEFNSNDVAKKLEELYNLLEDEFFKHEITYYDELYKNVTDIVEEIINKIKKYINNNRIIIDQIKNGIEIHEKQNLEAAIEKLNSLKNKFKSFNSIVRIYEILGLILYIFIYLGYQILYSIIFVIIIFDIFFFSLYYFGLRNNKILKTIKILWNILMIISILSFFIGGLFGIISFLMHDLIGFIMYIFGDENYEFNRPILINSYKDFIGVCIQGTNKSNLGNYYDLKSDDFDEFNAFYVKILKEFNSIPNLQKPSFEKIAGIENIKKELLKYKDLDLAINNFTIDNDMHIKTYWVTVLEKCNTIPKKKICCVISFHKYENGVCSEKDESYDIEEYKDLFVENFQHITNLYNHLTELQSSFSNFINDMINKIKLLHSKYVLYFESNKNEILDNKDLFSFMKCDFMKSDLIAVYRAFYELAYYIRVLCALVLCIAFFSLISAITIQISIMNFIEHNNDNENNDDEERFSISSKYKEKERQIIEQNKIIKKDNDNENQSSRISEMQDFN